MSTNFRRFKMLALRTMAGEALKDEVNDATSFVKRNLMTICVCVGLYDEKSVLCRIVLYKLQLNILHRFLLDQDIFKLT